MNREEAQFILGAYRPNSEDAHDPQFQPALSLVRQDPVLAQWFAEQQALDAAFAAKLRTRPVPADLKARLLLARTTGLCTPRWRQPAWIAVAACFALTFITGGLWLQHRARTEAFAEFRHTVAGTSLDMSDHFDVVGLDANGYKQWLGEHRGDPGFVLPASLAKQGISACKVFEWRQSHVTMLCIKVDGGHVDLFVVNSSDLPGLSLDSAPAFFAEDGGLTAAAWRREGKVYVLASTMPRADLQQLL